jgi:hypothetical protein
MRVSEVWGDGGMWVRPADPSYRADSALSSPPVGRWDRSASASREDRDALNNPRRGRTASLSLGGGTEPPAHRWRSAIHSFGAGAALIVVRTITILACSLCLSSLVAAQDPSASQPPPPPPPDAAQTPSPDPAGQPPPQRPLNPTQEIAGEQPEGNALDIGPARLRVGGYLGVTGIYRSTNDGGGPGTGFGTIPYDDTVQGNVSETRLSAQSSRISIRVDAPFSDGQTRFNALSGYFEMDFNGAAPGNVAVTSTSAGFRLRQAFAEVRYRNTFFLAAGQAFTLMTPPKGQLSIWPSDYEMSQAVDTNYLAGMVWERIPQVRFTWRPSAAFNWAVSVENPEQQIGGGLVVLPSCCADDIGAQYNTGIQELEVPNLMPDFVTRVAMNPTRAIHVDIGGVMRVFRHTVAPYDETFKAVGGGASANVRFNPTGRTRLLAQLAGGPGLGRYAGGLAPDVAFDRDGSISPIGTISWVGGVEQQVHPGVFVSGYYSGVAIDDRAFADGDGTFIGYGFPGASNAANRRIRQWTGTVSYLIVATENRGSVQMGVQGSWLTREPWSRGEGPASADAFLFFAQVRYNLP